MGWDVGGRHGGICWWLVVGDWRGREGKVDIRSLASRTFDIFSPGVFPYCIFLSCVALWTEVE